jgi:hypothetical protein
MLIIRGNLESLFCPGFLTSVKSSVVNTIVASFRKNLDYLRATFELPSALYMRGSQRRAQISITGAWHPKVKKFQTSQRQTPTPTKIGEV